MILSSELESPLRLLSSATYWLRVASLMNPKFGFVLGLLAITTNLKVSLHRATQTTSNECGQQSRIQFYFEVEMYDGYRSGIHFLYEFTYSKPFHRFSNDQTMTLMIMCSIQITFAWRTHKVYSGYSKIYLYWVQSGIWIWVSLRIDLDQSD